MLKKSKTAEPVKQPKAAKQAAYSESREPLIFIDDLPLTAKQRRQFEEAGNDAAFYAAEIDKFTALKKDALERAVAIAEAAGFERADGGDWTFSKTRGRRTLNQELLLENGVDMETIEASKKEGESSYSIRRKPQKGQPS